MVQKAVNVLIGETGSGKTGYIEQLYDEHSFEVINCDSRQIYRKLDIGTAKPNRSMLGRIKHHFIDIADITDDYDVMDFVNQSVQLLKREGNFIISAGTPFYLNILLNGISPIPPVGIEIKKTLKAQFREGGIEPLYDELRKCDPHRAEQLNPNDSQRIIRALEVLRETGKPISYYYKRVIKPDIGVKRIIYIRRSREELRKRIIQRTNDMINRGLLDETQSLVSLYGIDVLRSKKIIGYTEAIMHIDGILSIDDMRGLIVKNTMSYIKHQRTFFNKIIKGLPVEFIP